MVIICYTIVLLMLISITNSVATSDASALVVEQEAVIYLQIDYYVLAEGMKPGFINTKETLWKPVHDERVRQGEIIRWSLYDALISGPTAEYDYVSITMTDKFGSLYGGTGLDRIISVHSGKDEDEMIEKMHEGYRIVNSEIWRMNGAALSEEAAFPAGKYITKNYMDSRGASGEHESMELDFWKPIHYVRINQDILNSWVMYIMVKPGGASIRYNYSTIDYYDRLSDIEGSVGMELARIAHPNLTDVELSDFFTRTGQSRTAYKTELWREVVTTGQ